MFYIHMKFSHIQSPVFSLYAGATWDDISRYHGKRGISLLVIRYMPQFKLAVRHLGINHHCSLSPYMQYKLGLVCELFGWDGIYIS